MLFKRNIKPRLEKALSRSPVVLVTGARQIGKTTLIKEIAKEKGYTYITFDDIQYLSSAKRDPIHFLEALQKPVIFDEIQRVPEIMLGIKKDVDENRAPGRYLVTGSANPLLTSELGEFLVGRMEIIEMFPFSQGELLGKTEAFIDTIFNDKPLIEPFETLPRKELFNKILKGGTEINILLEDRAGNIVGIEVKSSSTISTSDLQGLASLREEMGNKFLKGVILYTGSRYVPLSKQIIALPINYLWATEQNKH